MISLLYVDDEPDLLDLCKLFLERDGDLSVVTAESVQDGLNRLASGSIDVVVSDYQMPDIDGLEFLKRVRAGHKDLPFILFTGRGREEVVIEAINNGVDFYLQKGGDATAQFAELRHKINNAVERRRAIDALKDSEQRLSDIINFLPDATFAINNEGTVIAWNKAIEMMTGVPAQEIIGKDDHEYSLAFYGDRRPKLIDIILESPEHIGSLGYSISTKTDDVLIAETALAKPLGKPGVFLAKASLLYDKHGDKIGAIESVRDITDSKKILETLHEREAELKSIFRAAPVGIGVIDNRVFSEVNEYFCTMTGYNKEELIGKKESMIFLSYGNYESAEREKYYQIAKKGTSSIEARWKKKDGTFIDVLICSAPLVPGNVALGITFTAIDITDRKRAADELRTAYEKNKGLMDFANDAIFITDIESGALIDANKKAQEMIGRTKPEIQKMQYIDLYPVENSEEYREQFHKYTNAGIGVGEGVVVDRDGHQIPVIISSTVLELEGRRCQMGIFHNISEIKIAQTALQLANKKLNLLAEITRHDIRNKLTVFSGYLDLFQEHPPEPQYSMYLTKLHEAVKTIGMNIEFTRLYQNLGVLAPEWQGVNEVFFSACRHVYLKKIRIQSDPDGFEIFADPLLERVFYNLVENAVQYGDRATIIRLTSDESADKLVIKIEDNGIGIPPHDKEKIFSKGFGKNTGLGLFLCREILSITGISIAETGQYQQGACFEIHVPHGTYRYRPGSIRDRCYISVDD